MMLEELYLEWCMDYCNNYFDKDNLPSGIKLAIQELVKIDPLQFGISSQSLHDMSITYAETGDSGIPKYILGWLEPYRRLKTL